MKQPSAAIKAPISDDPVVESDAEPTLPVHKQPMIAVDAILGAAGGAALGLITGGPPGAIAGAIIGGAVGAAAGKASESGEAQLERENASLDKDIGVVGGHIGEASANAPPAQIGAFSSGSMGTGAGGEEELAGGPMQSLDEN